MPSRVRMLIRSASNSATMASTLNSSRPTGTVGSYTEPPRLSLTCRTVSSSAMARASGRDRARRSSLVTTRVSPSRHAVSVAYVERSGLDSVTEYELWKAVWSSLDSANLHELDWTLRRHAGFVEHFVPMTFLSNHDVTRVASQVGDGRHLSHAVVLLGFLPGVPTVYHGDEFGLEGVKQDRPGGDDAVRPELPAERGLFTNPHPEVEEIYRRVIGLRRRNPWLADAVTAVEQVTNGHLVVRSRARTGNEMLALALNLTDAPYALPGGARVVESEPARVVESEPASGAGQVAPHGWVVFNP